MDKFNPRHFAYLILGTSIVSLKTYPGVFIRIGERDSWVAVIVSSALIYFIFMFLLNRARLIPENNMADIYKIALGKVGGFLLLMLYIITLFLTLVESASLHADTMHTNMMVETPNWYFLIFFIIPCFFIVRKNLVAIVTITLIGITLIMFAGINLSILTTKYKHVSMLFPIFQKGLTWDFFVCIIKSLGLYSFITITLPYLSKVKSTNKEMKTSVNVALIILIQMIIVSTTGIIMTFSLTRVNAMFYPKLIQTHLVSFFQFLEFGELYVMLQTLGGWLIKYIITFHAIIILLSQYRLKKKILHSLAFVLSLLVFIISFYISKTSDSLMLVLDIFPWIALANYIVIPIAVYTIYGVKVKKQGLVPSPSAGGNTADAGSGQTNSGNSDTKKEEPSKKEENPKSSTDNKTFMQNEKARKPRRRGKAPPF